MRQSIILSSLALVLCACSDGCTSQHGGADASFDAAEGARDASDGELDAGPDAAPDAEPDSSTCTCTYVTPCCDGCLATNVGVTCDDGLACVVGSTCSESGACTGGAPLSCPPVTEPQCQTSACVEPGGCATSNITGSCDDGNAQTYDDHCDAGACVGTACECSSGPCCDGCHFRRTAFKCVDDGPIYGDCYGAYDQVTASCGGTPTIQLTIGDRFCTGSSSECNGAAVSNDVFQTGTCETVQPDGMGSMPSNPQRCMPDPSSPLGETCRRCL